MKQKWRFMQDPAQMERITSEELGERLDEYLERCDKEDVGFVILHGDKEFMLCPARWFCDFDRWDTPCGNPAEEDANDEKCTTKENE